MSLQSTDLLEPLPTASSPSRVPLGVWPLRAIVAGFLYAVLAFLVGCAMGMLREQFVAPRITSELAIVVETPLMCWIVLQLARGQARWLNVPTSAAARLIMGSVAVGLLVLAENTIAYAWMGRSVFEQWGLYGYLAMAATFAGLTWFWLAPLIAARARSTRP